MKYFILLLVAMTTYSFAAPIPATSSSMLVSKHRGLYISKHNFKIHADNTLWENTGSPIENSNILTVFQEPQQNKIFRAGLTVRTDQLKKRMSLTKYMNKWKKDYIRFGFNILKHKKVKINNQSAFLLDLYNSNSKRQLRQLVFLKGKRSVILTCRGEKENFKTTVKSCNTIFKNFQWL